MRSHPFLSKNITVPSSSQIVSPLTGYILALVLGCLAYWLICGNPVDALSGGLMIDTDYPNAAAAYEIFVRDSWHWPLGESPHFGGVNIFFSDGAPWLALLSKMVLDLTGIFINFHWLTIINIVMFSLMARRLACYVTRSEWTRWLITLCLVFSLIMPVRMIGAQHIALSSYWVVLWGMCCVPLKAGQDLPWWRRWEYLLAVTIAILSHAYLGAMAIVMMGALLLSEKRWFATLLLLITPLFLLYIIGVFHGEHSVTEGAKAYALDLMAFAESLGWAIVPNLYTINEPPQSDAILYLGTGAWLLFAASVVVFLTLLLVRKIDGSGLRPSRRYLLQSPYGKRVFTLTIASLMLVIYGMAFDVRIAGHVLFSVDIPSLFQPLYERFRVTGRFAAPMAFMLIILVCLAWGWLSRFIPYALALSVGCLAIVLQVADARHAGLKSPPQDWLEDAQNQREAITSLLADSGWTGRVFKSVGYFELEQQRLIDRILVDEGARHFEVVHGARLDPDDVERRSGYEGAKRGDIVLLPLEADSPSCQGKVEVKSFTLCLVE
ncbi:hypothetical protein [Halomonas sp. WWR20]